MLKPTDSSGFSLDIGDIRDETSSESNKENSKSESDSISKSQPFNLINSIQIIIDFLDVNNNILMDNTENISKLAVEIKKELKSSYSDNLAYKFDNIFQKSMMLKIISDTDDMKEYYKLYTDLIGIKNFVINKKNFNKK